MHGNEELLWGAGTAPRYAPSKGAASKIIDSLESGLPGGMAGSPRAGFPLSRLSIFAPTMVHGVGAVRELPKRCAPSAPGVGRFPNRPYSGNDGWGLPRMFCAKPVTRVQWC